MYHKLFKTKSCDTELKNKKKMCTIVEKKVLLNLKKKTGFLTDI